MGLLLKEMIVSDRLWLDDSRYKPTKLELLKKAAKKPIRKLFTIDVGLEEDGVFVDCYPDAELRESDLPMRVQVADGMSQGEFLFYWRKIGEKAKNNWDSVLFMRDLGCHPAEPADEVPSRHERGGIT